MSKPRILLLEDDASLQLALRYLLEEIGYDVEAAQTHPQATQALDRGPFAATIMDYYLNDVPSTPFIAEFRARYPGSAVICASGKFIKPHDFSGAEGVPDAILRKPFTLDQLKNTLATTVTTQ